MQDDPGSTHIDAREVEKLPARSFQREAVSGAGAHLQCLSDSPSQWHLNIKLSARTVRAVGPAELKTRKRSRGQMYSSRRLLTSAKARDLFSWHHRTVIVDGKAPHISNTAYVAPSGFCFFCFSLFTLFAALTDLAQRRWLARWKSGTIHQ
jgi:hypothetical protein